MAKKYQYIDNTTGLPFESEAFESSDFTNVGGAGNENKPVVLDAVGQIHTDMINVSAISHNALADRAGIDTHPDFLDIAGTRAMTGDLNLGSNKLTSVATPTSANDGVNKAYADALAVGNRTKGNVVCATTGNLVLTGLQTIDGITVVDGDRVLVKDQTDGTENGIYVASAGAWDRSEDLDNEPQAELLNGVLVPVVLGGTVNEGKPFYISSVGSGDSGVHVIGTDIVTWEIFTSPTQLQGGAGIDIDANIINIDLVDADSGLTLVGNELGMDFATVITDNKAWKASDLNASLVPIIDAGDYTDKENAEEAIQELYGLIAENGVEYTVGTGGCTKGDLAKISGNDLASPYSDVTNAHRGIGLFLETKTAGEKVKVLANDVSLKGVLTGAVAGTPYYWNGSTFVDSVPSGGGAFVWQVGVASNATDLHVEVRYVKKNA